MDRRSFLTSIVAVVVGVKVNPAKSPYSSEFSATLPDGCIYGGSRAGKSVPAEEWPYGTGDVEYDYLSPLLVTTFHERNLERGRDFKWQI